MIAFIISRLRVSGRFHPSLGRTHSYYGFLSPATETNDIYRRKVISLRGKKRRSTSVQVDVLVTYFTPGSPVVTETAYQSICCRAEA